MTIPWPIVITADLAAKIEKSFSGPRPPVHGSKGSAIVITGASHPGKSTTVSGYLAVPDPESDHTPAREQTP